MTRGSARGSTRLKLDREESAMVGNVWEFCAEPGPYPSSAGRRDRSRRVRGRPRSRLLRGGGFTQRVQYTAQRPSIRLDPDGPDNQQGFRVVLDVSGPR